MSDFAHNDMPVTPDNKSAIHKGTHLQTGSREHDAPLRNATVIGVTSAAGVLLAGLLYLLYKTGWFDAIDMTFLVVVSLAFWIPFAYASYVSLGHIRRIRRRDKVMLDSLEAAHLRDIEGNKITVAPIPQHWLADYVSAVTIVGGIDTKRDSAIKFGLTRGQWEYAKEFMILKKLAYGQRVNQHEGFKIKSRITLFDIANSLPQDAPDVQEPTRKYENASPFPSEQSVTNTI